MVRPQLRNEKLGEPDQVLKDVKRRITQIVA